MGNILCSKKLLLTIIISTVLLIVCVGLFLLLLGRNEANEIEVVGVLSSGNEIEAVSIVEANTVKIINTLEGGQEIVGTGFFHQSGYLLTNSHIVDIKGRIKVYYPNGEVTDARLVANDIASDVAILKVDKIAAKAMNFGDTLSLEPPMTVISIGFAYNLEGAATVTRGAFSARRSITGIEYLQSDTGLNYGNSGGPLIDSRGYLMGMNSYSSENATINLSISSESLENIVFRLLNDMDVQYISGSRPLNALSSILKSVGFSAEDIYGESEYLEATTTDGDTDTLGNTDGADNGISDIGNSDDGNNENEILPEPEPEPDPEPIIITNIPFDIMKISGGGHVSYKSSINTNVMSFTYSIITSDGITAGISQFGVDAAMAQYTTIDVVESAVLEIHATASDGRLVIRREIPGSELMQINGVTSWPYITISEIRSRLTAADIYVPNNQYVLYSSIEVTFKDGKGTFKNGDWSYINP